MFFRVIVGYSMKGVSSELMQFHGLDSEHSGELQAELYQELRRIAAAKMQNERPGHTLQPTALVHEAWLKLSTQSRAEWKNRDQFYAVASEVMRRILVDRARRRRAPKHGGNLQRVELDNLELPVPGGDDLVLQVNEALDKLQVQDPGKAQVVKLRFFVGLENAEIAALLGVAEKTVQRHWSFAKAWLARAIEEST